VAEYWLNIHSKASACSKILTEEFRAEAQRMTRNYQVRVPNELSFFAIWYLEFGNFKSGMDKPGLLVSHRPWCEVFLLECALALIFMGSSIFFHSHVILL